LDRFTTREQREIGLQRFNRSEQTALPAAAGVDIDSVGICGQLFAPGEILVRFKFLKILRNAM
jgi:hypothetical protein